ncbi:MAG TPA: zinc-dependent alcohol dehydrogenase family protein [Candidatus Rubrimentiphilum sp.]|nr:zinc-dependent alcohol dehydrogenase family protein [Candidatus Rubrimentiphilum sp.]
MKAAVLNAPGPLTDATVKIEQRAVPEPTPGEVLLKVRACAICRTDLHIIEGELTAHKLPLVPGHQIVGEVTACGANVTVAIGTRVGVTWLGSVDETCAYCRAGAENLCDHPVFTGYDRDGGYAQYATVRADFCYPLPRSLDDVHAAPLLCAGTIGFRTMRVAGVERGERVGLYGFGASAHLVLPVLQSYGCDVFVATRGQRHMELAKKMGATWVGEALEKPPVQLDRTLTFAPSGDVVISALSALRKGGVVAINAIHLDRIPEFDYDSLLWGERQIRSVANLTRADAIEFLALAVEIGLHPDVEIFPLERVNDALAQLKEERLGSAAAVLTPPED